MVDTLREQVTSLSEENEFLRSRFTPVQAEMQKLRNAIGMMEHTLSTREQELLELRSDCHALSREKRELERKMTQETDNFEKVITEMHEKEMELTQQVQNLQGQLGKAKEDMEMATAELRAAKQAVGKATNEGPESAQMLMEDSFRYLREARYAQKVLKEKERQLIELKEKYERERTEQDILIDQCKTQQMRMACLENEVSELQRINLQLVEDCESYQRLLQEQTLNGSFSLNNQKGQKQPSKGNDLFAELSRATSSPPSSSPTDSSRLMVEEFHQRPMSREIHLEEEVCQLTKDLKHSQDEVKALSLYINKILARIIENNQFDMLAKDGDRPPTRANLAAAAAAAAAATSTGAGANGNGGGFDVIKRHFRQQSTVSVASINTTQTAQSNISGTPFSTSRPSAMKDPSVEPVPEEQQQFNDEEGGGFLKKAFKRMSVVGWRSPTAPSKQLSEDITTVMTSEPVES